MLNQIRVPKCGEDFGGVAGGGEVERRSISNFVYLLIQDAIDKAKAEGKIE